MCGILGVGTGSFVSSNEANHLRKLMILNSFRGEDSSGMVDYVVSDPVEREKRIADEKETFYKDEKNKRKKFPEEKPHVPVLWWKNIKHPVDFANTEMAAAQYWRWGLKDNELKMVIAHARAATQGKVIKENAHPFVAGHIIGVHNGTVTGTFKMREKFDTDSEAIYHNILEYGLEAALKGIDTDSTNCAYALAYIDTKEKSLNIIRNSQRPLHYYETGGNVYFSSEQKDLAYTFNVMPISVKQFDVGVHYKMMLGDKTEFQKTRLDVTRSYSYHGWQGNHNRWGAERVVDAEYSDDWGEYGVSSYPPVNNSNVYRSNAVVPFNGGNFREVRDAIHEDRRVKTAYNQTYRNFSINQMSNLGNNNYHSISHRHFEMLFNRYYGDFMWGVWCIWKKEHKAEYSKELNKIWDSITEQQRNNLLIKCEKGEVPKELGIREESALIPFDTNVDTFLTIPFGTQGKKCSELAFHQKTREGCTFCGDPVSVAHRLFWIDERQFLCEECQERAYENENHAIHETFDTKGLDKFVNDVTSEDLPEHNTVSNIAM